MLVSLLAIGVPSVAGENFNLKDITAGKFRSKTMTEVRQMADGETYAQISDDGKRIVTYSFRTGKETGVLFDATTARGASIEQVEGYILSPDGSRMLIQTQTKPIYRRSYTATYYIYNVRNNKLEPLSDGGPQQTPMFSPDGNLIAFIRDNNIWLVKLLYDNAESQVTKDGKRNEIINGIPDWVYEEEFSTNSSMVFSADSRQIVWIRYDESAVKQYSMQLFKGMKPERSEFAEYPGDYTYKYPVPGQVNSKVSVHSYDIQSHQTRTIAVPMDVDGYIPRIKATSDPSKVAVFTMNRHQDVLRIYMANPLSTVCQLAIEDKVDKYIKEETLEDVLLTDKHILLPSERDGYNHLYLYNLNGQLLRQIVTDKYVVKSVYGYDEQTGDTYFAANPKGPTDQQVMVAHANGKIEVLSKRFGVNNAIFSKNFKFFINIWSDLDHPVQYTLCQNNGKTLQTMIDNHELVETLSAYDLGKKELFTFTTSEGVQLNGWMVKPADFDVSKKYPVIMYQYGGPGNQQVLNQWGIGMNGNGAILEQYLCQQGYICVCVDNRGTGGRGADFEKCTYLRLGELESRDQVETALWLGQQAYVDKDRIGIWGWSYGGWNTLMSMSEGRPVFRAGVAIAPPTCWRYYDSIYTERYMRTPKENQKGYDEVNPIARASQLHGALLLCHGLADDNVHYQNTAEYVEALVQADKDFRQLVYTNRNHSIFGGNTRNHLFRQAINHFNAELK
ncbi:MAG: DPP IV N-terminal domain-containing protein [Prevotella sp.]|nr:DPP IV N-terminal domain-containing protein [Prevotella sp.]